MTPRHTKKKEPVTFVIFGATGDLALLKLLPALWRLYSKKLLADEFRVVAFARRPFSNQEFRTLAEESFAVKASEKTEYQKFLQSIVYHRGQFDEENAYRTLMLLLDELDDKMGACSHKIFHFSSSPFFYETILLNLQKTGLTISCTDGPGRTRVLVEKPIGNDSRSALQINTLLAELFDENQIFRIDHYLAKRGVEDFLRFRFLNPSFSNLLNAVYVEKVIIQQFETRDIASRGVFYDKIGALRDVGQNHLLELLSLVAMENPRNEGAAAFSKERSKVLRKLIIPDPAFLERKALKGQYEGYKKEEGVEPQSKIETYFRLPVMLDIPRWKNIPFVLESGKALNSAYVSIRIQFKNAVDFASTTDGGARKADVLLFNIQPESRVEFCRTTNQKESDALVCEISTYEEIGVPASSAVDDYERVYFDALDDDQSIFVGKEEVEAAWEYIDGVETVFALREPFVYEQGSDPKDF